MLAFPVDSEEGGTQALESALGLRLEGGQRPGQPAGSPGLTGCWKEGGAAALAPGWHLGAEGADTGSAEGA